MCGVHYLLQCKGYSDHGGFESYVRGFVALEAAQTAMIESYRKLSVERGVPVGRGAWNRNTTKTQNSIRLNLNGDWFEWKIIQVIPEDCDPAQTEDKSWDGLGKYTVTIEEHIAQEFTVEAYDIFHAVDSAVEDYKRGILVVQSATPNARLIMARANKTGETTEWKEF